MSFVICIDSTGETGVLSLLCIGPFLIFFFHADFLHVCLM